MRSRQQKMGLSRSVSQHGSATVGEAVVGEAVVGEAVGAAVGAVGDTVVGEVVGVVVGQSVPRAVPVVVYAAPVLRGTTGPHSPALVWTYLHRRTQPSVRSESKPSQRPG
jgi:Na+/citrate or Na+/malate symporter